MIAEYLLDGEDVTAELRGNAYTLSSNPLTRMIMSFFRIFATIFGKKREIYAYVTKDRVILLENSKYFWALDGSISVTSAFPRSILEVGYRMDRSFIFFKTHYLYIARSTDAQLISSKNGKEGVLSMINKIKDMKEKATIE